MQLPEPVRELRPHILWDGIKEAVRMMLPFLAGLAAKEWFHEHATALTWTAALGVATLIAFWDKIVPLVAPPSQGGQGIPSETQTTIEGLTRELGILRSENSQLNQHRVDLFGTISGLKDTYAEQLRGMTEENSRLREANENLRDPNGAIGRRVNTAVDEFAVAEALKNAPGLRVDYKTDGVKDHLTLINEGDETIYQWNLRPLRIAYSKPLSTHFGNPAIESKHKFPTEVIIGDLGKPLYYFVHKDLPSNAKVVLEVYYEDRKGNGFTREFEAKTYMNETLLLQPGPIKPQLL